MPRTLTAAMQTEIAKAVSRSVHLLRIGPVNGITYYFAEDQVWFQGNKYDPWLILDSGVKYSHKLSLDPVPVRLQNITLEMAALLKAQSSFLEGAEATLQRLYLGANEAVTLFVGRVAGIEVDQQNAQITLAGDLDPTASQVPKRKFSATCVWDFKDAECGYVDGVDPNDPATGAPFIICSKDFLSCVARGRTQRFPGFIHISRDLTLLVEGQAPDASQPERTLAEMSKPWEEV